MASLDRARDAVVVRIVYDGPPIAGKTTTLKALAERLGQGQVRSPEQTDGRTLFFDWVEYVGGRFEGRQIRCQIASVPGQLELLPRRLMLLATADAVVFVGDTSRMGLNESRAHLEDLLSRVKRPGEPQVGVVLQANKRDLPDAVPLAELVGTTGLAVVESVASKGEGVREAFVFAVRLALDRVRELNKHGALRDGKPETEDPADALLRDMLALPLNPLGRALWPSALEREQAQKPSGPPRVPDASIPSGWIWPPVHGRVYLQEAAQPDAVARELTAGEWLCDGAHGWRFHSMGSAQFTDLEAARSALIRWAQLHAVVGPWVSPLRCVALSQQPDGTWRLWQAVRTVPSVWQRLTEGLQGPREAARISTLFSQAATQCSRAAARWSQAPIELPCTLETVSAELDPCVFVGLMPSSPRPTEVVDRRARLWQQLHSMLNAELGEAHYVREASPR